MRPTPKRDKILKGIDAGECEAGILTLDEWRQIRIGSPNVCRTKARLPDVIFTMPNTIVVRDEIAQLFGWAVSTAVDAGRYQPHVDQVRASSSHPPRCACHAAIDDTRAAHPAWEDPRPWHSWHATQTCPFLLLHRR